LPGVRKQNYKEADLPLWFQERKHARGEFPIFLGVCVLELRVLQLLDLQALKYLSL